MVTINDLSFNYGNEAVLKEVNLHIEKNSTCVIIGPSGCGKTTLLYILAGLLSEYSGAIGIDGREAKGVRRETGLVLQNGGLLPWKNVYENIALGLKARSVNRLRTEEIVNSILEELNIPEHKYKFPSQLSGGQKQRAAIGRTLALEPDLLLMDEASSALDAINKEILQNIILKMYKKRKMTLIMVTHSIEEAVFLGQRIVIMEKGSIKQVIENPNFGDEEIRMSAKYYELCGKVRQYLGDGALL